MAQESMGGADRLRVQGLYALGHTLLVLDTDLHRFGCGDIECVESFWAFGDLHRNSAGFVLRLRDGRHAYLDFLRWHGYTPNEDFGIEVGFLSDDQAYPSSSSPLEPIGGWSSETVHLTKLLAG